MKNYKLINRIVGWLVFAISATTYILTTEDSASFWDCGEFISTSDKLLVGHPPGAPFFMIVGRLFAIFAPDPTLVAKSINIMSALASAFTILFLFWTITHLAKKLVMPTAESMGETWRVWAVMGAGAVGSLAYTFSDTFWFSAVEGEVYAMSSLFTAAVFWAILKWEEVSDTPRANKWIILIAYLMGLSIGVHLLNLLCIPAIVMVYYFKKYKVTSRNTVMALLLSCVLIVVILYGIIPGIVKIASYVELTCVNEFGWSYNVGATLYALLVMAVLAWSIWYTFTNNHRVMNTIMTSVAVILIGYSSFAMIVIRSSANPTMDQNSPDNVFSLMDYLNREQYGNRPLFYGQHFNSVIDRKASSKDVTTIYMQRNGRYEPMSERMTTKYYDNMLFPRMYSSEARHIEQYKAWSNFKGTAHRVVTDEGSETIVRPTFWENIRFFWSYQVNFMYWRYFMWNFSGRQNDIQSHGELIHGNWITGISFIDNLMLGDQSQLPDSLKNNKGCNKYYMLPFILGLIGLFYQLGRGETGKQGFWIVFLLFFMTGLAIVIYLNQTPLQPRERDYAYAGSFYAFTIWIGLGVLAIVDALVKLRLPRVASVAAATFLCLLSVPCVMAQQNWDDHDRSGCNIARDLAYNYLNSCEENAVIFTNGDNDTFPLWYAQEVEGIRTDVRVCNLSYLQTDWYCDQMKRKAYDSDPLPIQFTHDEYTGRRDIVYLLDEKKTPIDLAGAMLFVKSENPQTKRLPSAYGNSERIDYLPGRKFMLPIDTLDLVKRGVLTSAEAKYGVSNSQININFGGRHYMLKNDLMMLDMLVNSKWERPMYIAVTVGSENYAGLSNNIRLEGLAYRISPVSSSYTNGVNIERMYHNVMDKFRWGFYNKPGIYLDENKCRMASNLRANLTRLAAALTNVSLDITQNGNASKYDTQKYASAQAMADEYRKMSLNILDKIENELPSDVIPHNYFSLDMAMCYYKNNELEKGESILRSVANNAFQELRFYISLDLRRMLMCEESMHQCIAIYYEVMRKVSELDEYGRKMGGDDGTRISDSALALAESLNNDVDPLIDYIEKALYSK